MFTYFLFFERCLHFKNWPAVRFFTGYPGRRAAAVLQQ